MNYTEEIRKYVKDECGKSDSKYGYEPYEYHFVPMVRHAVDLAEALGADKEVVELAAWLHDIGSIKYGREDHHLTGCELAAQKLTEIKYPEEKKAIIIKCIMNHRGSQKRKRNSLEEKIIADADALSNFENIAGIFKAAFVYENKTQGEAKKSVRKKLERKWEQLHFDRSKEIIKPKYNAVKILLER